jgi:hypothetical protein
MKRLSLHGSDTVLLSPFIKWKYYQETVILYREQGTRRSHFFGKDGLAASAKLSLPHLWDKVILSYDACEERHNVCCSTAEKRPSPTLAPVGVIATMCASRRRITSCTTGCARTCCSSASVALRAFDVVGMSCRTLRFCFLLMRGSPWCCHRFVPPVATTPSMCCSRGEHLQ